MKTQVAAATVQNAVALTYQQVLELDGKCGDIIVPTMRSMSLATMDEESNVLSIARVALRCGVTNGKWMEAYAKLRKWIDVLECMARSGETDVGLVPSLETEFNHQMVHSLQLMDYIKQKLGGWWNNALVQKVIRRDLPVSQGVCHHG